MGERHFRIALAGGTGVVMSTFATRAELEYQLRMGDVSLLISSARSSSGIWRRNWRPVPGHWRRGRRNTLR